MRKYEILAFKDITEWMRKKGYSASDFRSIAELLNEIDWQARESGRWDAEYISND